MNKEAARKATKLVAGVISGIAIYASLIAAAIYVNSIPLVILLTVGPIVCMLIAAAWAAAYENYN